MANWHPYPFTAMMGARSAAEQPGFIANIPRWGVPPPPHQGSSWQPYPYQAMLGSRSLTQQPGYLGAPWTRPGGTLYPGYPLGVGGHPGTVNDPFADYVRRQYGSLQGGFAAPTGYPQGTGYGSPYGNPYARVRRF